MENNANYVRHRRQPKTSYRRMCGDPQEIRLSKRYCARKNKWESAGMGMVERGGKEEEKKNLALKNSRTHLITT